MKSRIAIAISIIVLVAAGAIYAAARAGGEAAAQGAGLPGMGGKNHRFARHMMARLAERLGLTDAQKAEIRSIITAERPTLEPLARQMAKSRQELRTATANGHFDEAQVRALAAQQAQTFTDLIVEKERVKSKVYGVLTPEQRAKAEQMRGRWEARIRQHSSE